jgi:ammonium transporter, Amt family
VAFQLMFAVITPAFITGASADRLKFGAFVVFVAVWLVVVYAPIAHWVFSPHGWLFRRGVLDFAGGNVVEINSGASALALAMVLGPRRGWPRDVMAPHSLPLTVMGAGILWFGWFGFNAGSALGANDVAAQALVNTQLAACTGLAGWLALEKWRTGHATTLGAASGAVAGLVAITPGAGYVNAMAAMLIGVLGGVTGVLAVAVKFRLRYDDSLDVVGVHGACGVVGTLLLGVLSVHGAGGHLLGEQALAVVCTIGWAFTLTYVVATLVERTIGLRVPLDTEVEGLDTAVHAESAYDFGNVRAGRMG